MHLALIKCFITFFYSFSDKPTTGKQVRISRIFIIFGVSTEKSKFSMAGASITNLALIIMTASQAKRKQNRVPLIEICIFVFEPTKIVKTALWRREQVASKPFGRRSKCIRGSETWVSR